MQSTFETAHAAVQSLAKEFDENRQHCLSPDYQESEVRKEFIDKMWIALGWDVGHDWQKNPFEQEVKVERGIAMNGSQRRADYAFFAAPNFRDVRFFVEAKKPFGDLATAQNCFQTIRYGWNAQTLVAVLTDFEQFAILDCRFKPDVDTSLSRCIRKFHYSDYADPDKFAYIYHLFSRDSAAGGSLEKFTADLPKRRGKAVQRGLFKGGCQRIDDAFLEELDGYRDALARSFKNKNPDLSGETLTEITQRTIDRLVFIRFLEDKMIYPETLISEFGNKGTVWQDFIAVSHKLNSIYNGIVFKPHDLLDAPGFNADDDSFADICEQLAHINSPYDFNSIPIHILGSIYERFLGNVIVTTDQRARLEAKPEVRKAGGVYYTPEYIVRYIVENTVGKQIEGKTPEQIADMRFADIACGSGSFLLGVFDLLLSYHSQWYTAHPKEAKKAGCRLGDDGAWHLSLKQRREILLNNIYGVDIDNQAVEVAQLSLYLKLLEEETTSSARNYQMEFHETLLPPLNKNIVCGNSLIGADILTGQLFDPVAERKLNPMDWTERFPEIMKRGGFDAVVGNPPWVDIKGLAPIEVDYYFARYDTVANRMNVYAVFMHRAWSLVKHDGFFGYITPNSFLTQSSYMALRRMFLKGNILALIRMPDNVFDGVIAETCISVVEKRTPSKQLTACVVCSRQTPLNHIRFPEASTTTRCNQASWLNTPDCIFNLRPTGEIKRLLDKIQNQGRPLIELCEFCLGITPYDKYKGHTPKQMTERVFHSKRSAGNAWKKLLNGSDVQRYHVEWRSGEYIHYGPWLGAPREKRFFTQPRIIVRQIISGKRPRIYAAYTNEEIYHTQVAFALLPSNGNPYSILYLLGLINSQLMTWRHRQRYLDPEKYVFQKILIQDAKQFPAYAANLNESPDKLCHDNMVSLVEQMLGAKQQLAAAQSDRDKECYEHKCDSLDRQIDALVYELYGLTEAEIAIVEGANSK